MWVQFGFVYMELALNYLLFLNMIGVCCVNGVERFCEIIFHTLYVLLLWSIAHYGGVEGDKGATVIKGTMPAELSTLITYMLNFY